MTKWLTITRNALPGVLLAALATACTSGGDSAAKNDTWAQTLCGAAQGPIAQSKAALTDTGTVKQGESPAALQTRLAADLGTLATASTQLASAVQQAGAPGVSNGQQVQQNAVTELQQAAAGYQAAQKKAQSLNTASQAEFASGLRGLSDQVQQLSQLSSSALTSLQTGSLGTAIANQAGCKSVNAATPPAGTSSGASAGAPASAVAGSSAPASAKASATSSAKASAKASATGSSKP
jgi:hypothetical protein